MVTTEAKTVSSANHVGEVRVRFTRGFQFFIADRRPIMLTTEAKMKVTDAYADITNY